MEEKDRREFYNTQRLLESFRVGRRPMGRYRRIANRFFRTVDTVSGFLLSLLGVLILFAPVGMIYAGLLYGLPGFLATTGGTIGLVGYVVHRKVGQHLIFQEYNFLSRIFAVVVAFLLLLGMLFFVLRLPWQQLIT